MVHVIQVCWQLASRIRRFRPDPARKQHLTFVTAVCAVIIITNYYCSLSCHHYHPLLLLSVLSSLSSTATTLSVVPKQGIKSDTHVPLTAMSLLARNYGVAISRDKSVHNSMSREDSIKYLSSYFVFRIIVKNCK